MEELKIGEKVYISSKRAAQITGYAKDYIGQLCREGRVEARLVGRSWYVLEDAIREHRFGKVENTIPEVLETPKSIDRGWERPIYKAESGDSIPTLAAERKKEGVYVFEKEKEVAPAQKTVEDMQQAWKEWFRSENKALPDGSADFKEEYLPIVLPEPSITEHEQEDLIEAQESSQEAESDEMVPISRIPDSENQSVNEKQDQMEVVPLNRSYNLHNREEVLIEEPSAINIPPKRDARATSRKKSIEKKGGYLIIKALFIVIAASAALVAFVGSGNIEKITGYTFTGGIQRDVIRYLGGESEYIRDSI